MMRILLTGAYGNLGRALTKKGVQHEFVPIGRSDWSQLESQIDGVKLVIHAASDLGTDFTKDPVGVMDSNVMATARLLQSLKGRPDIRLFFISSCAVYGRSELTSEDVPPAPITMNGVTKLLNEQMVTDFATAQGIDYQILRLFNTFGGSDRFSIISHLKRSVDKGVPFTMFNKGKSQRDFAHVDDLANVILQLAELKTKYRILNIGTGDATKISDIVGEFRKKHPRLEVVNKERPEAEYSRADISRLRELLPDYSFRSVLNFIQTEI